MKKTKHIKLNSILLNAVFAVNSLLSLAPDVVSANELVDSEEMEQIESLCVNFITDAPEEKTKSMLELANLLRSKHKGTELGNLNADLREEEKEFLKNYSDGFDYIDDFTSGFSQDLSDGAYSSKLDYSQYNYSGGDSSSNNLYNSLASHATSGPKQYGINSDFTKSTEFKIDIETINFFNTAYNKEQKKKDYISRMTMYPRERELIDKMSNQYLINNKEKRLNTSWVNFAKNNMELIDKSFSTTDPQERSDLQENIFNKCKNKLAFDSATNIEDKSSGEEYELVLKNYEKLFGSKKADEPNSVVSTSPTCVEGEDSNMMLIDSNGRQASCDKLNDSPLKESQGIGGILSMMELPSQQILKRYGTKKYCNTCLKNKYDFYSNFNNKLSKNKNSSQDEKRQKERWDNKLKESNKKLNKELQLKAISNSILKLSDLSEQYQHSLAWMDKETRKNFKDTQKPCVTEDSIEEAINSSNQCSNNEYKLDNDEILSSISFSLGTQLDSFGEVEGEIQKIMKKSLKASDDVQCNHLSREDFVRRSAAVNFQTNATRGAEYIINQMLAIARKDIDSYRQNNSDDSAMTPIQFLTNVLSSEVLKDEIYHADPFKRKDKSKNSTTPLTDFFKASRSGISFTVEDVLKDIPQLSNFAKDRALTNTLATSQSQNPTKNKLMIQASVTAYLSKVARTNPQLYFLLNDKEYFLDKADNYKKSNSNKEFTDFISNNGTEGEHMQTLAKDYSKYQDNKCKVFMKEIAEAACPSQDYHKRFSNKDKKLAANSLAKKENEKRAIGISRFFKGGKVSDKEYYLNMIALESAACSQTLTPGLPISKLKDSPLLDIDYSIAPTSKSDYQDILKGKLGLGKVKAPKNKLNEFAQTKMCDVKALDKVFKNYAINPYNPTRLEKNEMNDIANAFLKEESRVKEYNKLAQKAVENTSKNITDNLAQIANDHTKDNLSQQSKEISEQILASSTLNTDFNYGTAGSSSSFDPNNSARNTTNYSSPTLQDAIDDYSARQQPGSSMPFSLGIDLKTHVLTDLESEFQKDKEAILTFNNDFGIKDAESYAPEKTAETLREELITAEVNSEIIKTYETNTFETNLDSPSNSLLSKSVTESITSEALRDLESGDMESYNNRVSYQDPMYREMLNETSLQHPKNIEQEKIKYDEYLSQKEENPSELKTEVDKLMAEIEELNQKKNEDKLTQLKAKKKAIEQELLTAQEDKLESEIKQKSAEVAQVVASTNTSGKKAQTNNTKTTSIVSATPSYTAPVATSTNSFNNSTPSYSNSPQQKVSNSNDTSSRTPASIKRTAKKSALSAQNNSSSKRTVSSSFNPIGILSSDGKSVDNGALDTYLTKIKEQDITDQSQLVHFENVNGTTVVKFSNTDGTNVEVDLSQIKDQDVLTELYQIQANLEFSEKEIVNALEKQKNLVEKNDVVISEIIKTNEEEARLKLLKEKLKLASQAYKAATN